MKNYKTIPRSGVDTIVDSVICDLCHRTYPEDWGKETGKVLETTVSLRTGYSDSEGGSGQETAFDICPECFRNHLIPMLMEQGAKPTESEWDY